VLLLKYENDTMCSKFMTAYHE